MTLGAVLRGFAPALALAGALLLAPLPGWAAKNTPFGSELVAPNYPDSSPTQTFAAMDSIAQVGGHVSFVWIWNDTASLEGWLNLVPVAKAKGLKVFLQVGTTFLGNPAPPAGYAPSFADIGTRLNFLWAVRRLAETKPDYLVLTTELNFVYKWNRQEFENFRSLYAQAYQLVKEISPGTKVGVSHHYSVWFIHRFVDYVDVPAMVTPSDFIAFTTYPEDLVDAGIYPSISAIPADWFGLARLAYPSVPILFSEVGWSSKAPHSSPALQAEFVRNLPRLMSLVRPELVTWALFADVGFFQRNLLAPQDIAFLEGLGVDIDRLFIRFNGLGLIDFQGVPKPALDEAAILDFSLP